MTDTGFISIIIIAIGLSADCFAVSIASSVTLRKISWRNGIRVALAFGIFQAGMTLIGWLAGSTVNQFIAPFDHWLAFGLLSFIGGKMIWEALRNEEGEKKSIDITRWRVILVLALATSIDALAVGLSFAFLNINIALASGTIGVTALLITTIGLIIGKKVGTVFGERAEIAGGIVLIGIGIKILIEHLC